MNEVNPDPSRYHPPDEGRPCDGCGGVMFYTGLPNFSGPVQYRFFRCRTCGVRRVDVDEEPVEGWG